MLHFSPTKMIAILVAVLFGVLLASPNLFNQSTLDSLPDWMPKNQVALGLDLQGGVHLQVKIETEDIDVGCDFVDENSPYPRSTFFYKTR